MERKLVAETAELVDPLWRGCDVRDGEVRWRASIESLDREPRWRVAMALLHTGIVECCGNSALATRYSILPEPG
ncbi:hypothetical protein JZ785_25660 [Alicyclobacillus curvatus]|nr:hypothetical protein JZ785_25660 [Alicyclobacillus curvatus]